jgi:hypothetical protein
MKTERVQRIMIVGLLLVVGLLGYAQASKSGIAQANAQEPCQVGAYQVHDLKTTLGEGAGAVEYTATLLFDTRDGRTWYFNIITMQWEPLRLLPHSN